MTVSGWRARIASTSISFEVDAAIGNHAQRNDLEIANLVLGFFAAVGFNQADDDVDALLVLEQERR